MPVTPTYPGVYIEELPSPVHTIAGVATSIAAFVGYTASGIDNRAQQILSFADYERLYGPLASDSELSYAVQQFFSNGGSQAYVVRTPRVGAAAATFNVGDFTFTALSTGAWANGNILVDVDTSGAADIETFNLTVTNLVDGTIEKFSNVTVNTQKKNYFVAVVNDPDTGSELISASATGGPSTPPPSTGVIGTNALTAVAAQLGTSTKANADYSLTITTTAPSTPPAALSQPIKIFANGAPVPQSVTGLAAQVQQVVNTALGVVWPGAYVQCTAYGNALRINAYLPGYIDAVLAFGGNAATLLGLGAGASANDAHYALASGSDGTGLPVNAQLIGDQASFTGIYALDKVDLFNILCIPDATRASASDQFSLDANLDPVSIYANAISYCDQRRAMLLLDPPPAVKNPSAALDWKSSTIGVHDKNGACYFPRVRLADANNDYQLRTFAPCGVVAGLWSRIDASRGVWKAPAGTEAILTGVQSLVYKMSDAENGVLNPLAVNCFRSFPIYGNICWGARTLVGTDAEGDQWKYIPVRRLALYIEESLYRGTKWAVFEPNDEPLWAQLRLNVGSFMHDLFRQGAFQGQTPADAYLVKCDSTTTTQNDIDLGRVNILVAFAPLKPAEFVVIQIQQLAGQLQT
jgi:phage tail sheath protein FI